MTFRRIALAFGLAVISVAAGAQQAARSAYIVQMADIPVAAYKGSVSGYAPTKPAAGSKLNVNASAVKAYISYLDAQRNNTLASVSGAQVFYKYNLAFNGFAAKLTPAEVQKLRADPKVLAISADLPRKVDTNRTPAFLGLSAPGGVWSLKDANGKSILGEDVIVGIVDSGIWPEDPSFSDKVDASGKPVPSHQAGTVVYSAPPARWSGTCQTGAGFTADKCNNKLIGARYYRAGMDSAQLTIDSLDYVSPRDGDGHGSHTASTAAGNSGVEAIVNASSKGIISGMAPRARIAAYKVCWEFEEDTAGLGTCISSDSVSAIDQAVADGVDVINFSISGTRTNPLDPVEVAFLFAADAGVFVAASAGNNGPANTVAHMSPWLTTVAASTHDRLLIATATLGNGASFTGPSQSTGVPSKPLILSTQASLLAPFDDTNTAARLCFLGALDPAKVAGKIVVCDRGTNARVEKSQEVFNRGGAGMILVNASAAANDTIEDAHFVSTVHLPLANRAAVRDYAAIPGATASIGIAVQDANVVAPVMAGFSSRGPNLSNTSILKPDISAPGVNVLAAMSYQGSQAEHDAIVGGTLTPPPFWGYLSGTSMSSPHIAGISALMKQLRPTWSPAAIKSALMTSTNGIKLADGTLDPDRWGYGAGHVNPNGAAGTTLVYDAGFTDYLAFLCGSGWIASASSTCRTVGSIPSYNLNLASLTGDAVGRLSFRRTVTNAGSAPATYVASSSLPGFNVAVSPATITLAAGASASFDVSVTRTTAALDNWVFGNLVWTSGAKKVVSPLTVRALESAIASQVDDLRAVGSKVVTIGTGYDGSMTATPAGLVPAVLNAGTITTNDAQCFNVNVSAGALHARFALFNADTAGGSESDLDLEVYLGNTLVGNSGSGTSDELVDLPNPAPGTYLACVIGYSPKGGSAAYKLSSWVVNTGPGTGSFRAIAPAKVYTGATASVGLSWSVAAGQRHLGVVRFKNGAGSLVGSTLVSIDAASAVPQSVDGAGRKRLVAIKR